MAAVILRQELASVLFEPNSQEANDLEWLNSIENQLDLEETRTLITGTKAERSARTAATYGLLNARALREVRPTPGDILRSVAPEPEAEFEREVSSVGPNGRIYFRGFPPKGAWPSAVRVISRNGSDGHTAARDRLDADQRNVPDRFQPNLQALNELKDFEVETRIPSHEATIELEHLLATEKKEGRFQKLIERHPALLASIVVGNWRTFVIPQSRLGSQYVTDFLVLGINSAGMQWVQVEIESPEHRLHNKDGSLTGAVRHAVGQIHDWREWLTTNIAYAQTPRSANGLGLHGITNLAPGLVIIGRAEASTERDPQRRREEENARIEIHSYDWLLRHAKNLQQDAISVADAFWNQSDF